MSKPRLPHLLLLFLLFALAVAVVCLVVIQVTGSPHLQALARMTGSESRGGGFGQLRTYLDNLQKSGAPDVSVGQVN